MQRLTVELVMKRLNKKIFASKQKGVVLILIAFIIGLATAAYLLKTLNASNLKAEQDAKTMQSLKEAKVALIAWAVSHPNVPGLMPYPDRNVDGNYDDTSDCYASNTPFNPNFVLGRLPLFKNDPNCISATITAANGLSEDFRDGTGERLWYEVSSNLLYDYSTSAPSPNREPPIVNPSIVNNPLVEPWMIVRDRNGVILSSRVAAVIISPGPPLPNQDRSGGIANPDQYLDKVTMADNTPYKNSGYQDPATNPVQEFIIGDDYKRVAKNDPTYKDQTVEPYYFNDKLVYITIDELIYAVERRVLEETKNKLNAYYAINNYYPFAAGLGSTTNPNQCVQGNYRGLLPVSPPSAHTCTYKASSRTSNCNFSIVSSVSFTRTTGTFVATGAGANSPTGACSVSPLAPKVCTCNGLGACKRASGAIQYNCDECGKCTATVAGTNTFNTTGNISASSLGCTNTATQASCSDLSDGTFTLAACNANEQIKSQPAIAGLLPAWFMANKWQDFITYSASSNCTSSGVNCTTATPQLTVGLKAGVRAIVASPSAEIVATPYVVSKAGSQGVRPSCDIKDYLDATENTNMPLANGLQDFLYQPTQTKGRSYNDQIVIVSP